MDRKAMFSLVMATGLTACASSEPLRSIPSMDISPKLDERLQTLAGAGATACGYVGENSEYIDEAVACVRRAYASKRPFTFAFGSDAMWLAYAWDGNGYVTQVMYMGGEASTMLEGRCRPFEVTPTPRTTVHCSI
jgi:hypothetical protein